MAVSHTQSPSTKKRLLVLHTAEREIAIDVKENFAYIALDSDTKMKEASESSDKKKTWEFPHGNCYYY